jgi:hypothetical protein
MLADRGHHVKATELASSAVALVAQADLLSQHADALLDPLVSMLRLAAIPKRRRKSNLPGTWESLGYLSRYAPI